VRKNFNALIGLVLIASSLFVGAFRPAPPLLTYTLQDYDSAGKLTYSITRPSHSYVVGFLIPIYANMAQSNGMTYKDITNTSRTTSFGYSIFLVNAAAGAVNQGIVTGTGTAAITQTDYALTTPIANGSGAGQLLYSAESYTNPAVVGAINSFTTSRTVANSSGGTITINEIALYILGQGTGTAYYVCGIHDLVAGGQAIVNTHNLVITYTLSTTY
jgi:hypothetical protein